MALYTTNARAVNSKIMRALWTAPHRAFWGLIVAGAVLVLARAGAKAARGAGMAG